MWMCVCLCVCAALIPSVLLPLPGNQALLEGMKELPMKTNH